ncbi:MAG: hypothetical protein QXO70_00910 [Candidatus Pacearchaeota archaeon]
MSGNVLRKMFAKDIDKALEKAREDERTKCKEEYRKQIAERVSEIEGKYLLLLKEKESELKSMALRLQAAEEKVKNVSEQRQKMREQAIVQRQLTSDLVFIMKEWQERRAEELQPFLRLEQLALNIEQDLMKLE